MPAKKQSASPPPVLQWIAAGLGVVVTLAVIGVVVWEAMQPARPPDLSARIVAVTSSPHGRVAEVKVSNRGLETAAAVEIEGRLGEETSTATLDYVPGQGEAEAFLRFDGDPRAAELTVLGWSRP